MASGFGRFSAQALRSGGTVFRDHLTGHRRVLTDQDTAVRGGAALLATGFDVGAYLPATIGPTIPVASQSSPTDDGMFWQFPCRTEGVAWSLHTQRVDAGRTGNEWHVYLGMPWATWIDKTRKNAWGAGTAQQQRERQCRLARTRLSGIRIALAERGYGLRVHTVCQHVYWRDLLPGWIDLGVTDVWLSHCPEEGGGAGLGLHLHPWRLFAVNVEDPQRHAGLEVGRDSAQRSILASFIGAHADHYLSDIRLRLKPLAAEPGFIIEVTDRWHFEDIVYRQQVQGLNGSSPDDGSAMHRYNRVLSDSVFSLCPPGAGQNTLRLWESLACGSIPVLFDPMPRLPQGGTLAELDWDSAVVRVSGSDLSGLADRLRRMPLAERRQRQRRGRELFERSCRQTCF